jgi:hypothetical protein
VAPLWLELASRQPLSIIARTRSDPELVSGRVSWLWDASRFLGLVSAMGHRNNKYGDVSALGLNILMPAGSLLL